MLHERSASHNKGVRQIGFSEKIWRCLERSERNSLVLKSGTYDEMVPILNEARKFIKLADGSVISAILDKFPKALQIASDNQSDLHGEGIVALLPLNELGLAAIIDGSFLGAKAKPEWIIEPGEQPSAVYVWLVHMPGSFGRLLGAFATALEPYLREPVPIFTRPVNDHAVRLQRTSGFLMARDFYPDCPPDLRVALPERPIEARKAPKLEVAIARSIEEIFQVFSVRSATYIAEQFCLYSEEFDGNDFCATQLLGKVDGDAAGCVRLRFFDGFAKLERLAVRAEYRQSRLAFQLVRAAINHCRKKGYRKVLGHSRLDLVRFWRVFGFKVIESRPPFSFANVQYVEIMLDMEADHDAISVNADPMVIIRPEGAWDRPGPFDLSASALDPRRKKLLAERTRTIRRQNIVA